MNITTQAEYQHILMFIALSQYSSITCFQMLCFRDIG